MCFELKKKTEVETKASDLKKEEVRACQLQAKWNGTTFQEEWEQMHRPRKPGSSIQQQWVEGETSGGNWTAHRQSGGTGRVLRKSEAAACKYYNQHIKGNKDCCKGQTCSSYCPYAVVFDKTEEKDYDVYDY